MDKKELADRIGALLLMHNSRDGGAAPIGPAVEQNYHYYLRVFEDAASGHIHHWDAIQDLIAERHPEVYAAGSNSLEAEQRMSRVWNSWKYLWENRQRLPA